MGFDNQLFSFIRDGQHESMGITILGSQRSLQLKNQKPIPYVTHETSQQTERSSIMVDREATTRDRKRERVRQRYSRDLDVRYMSSWKNLKEKLLSTYSCDQHQCPMIRERWVQHNQSSHGGRGCDKKCTLASSKSKNCVSIRAGPIYDQYSDQKCSNCPMPHTSSNDIKHISNNQTSKYHECCTKPTKGNLKTDRKYREGSTSPFNNALKIKNEFDTEKNRFEEYIDTSCKNNIIIKNENDNANCCDIKMPEYIGNSNTNDYMSGRYIDGCTTPSHNIILNRTKNDQVNNCCNISGNPEYTDSCTGHATNYRDSCTDFSDTNAFVRANRYVGGCHTPSNTNFTNNRSYVDGCCDTMKIPDCTDNYTTTYSNSYVGNIEAPRFPLVQSNNNHVDDCQPGTSKGFNDRPFISKADRSTNTPTMVNNGNTCEKSNDKTPCEKLFTVDVATGDDSIMSSLLSIVKNGRKSKNKPPKPLKHSPNIRRIDSSTSHPYKPILPYAVDKSSISISDSKLSLKNNATKYRRNSNNNPIYKEVKEWIREIPMYPGSEKEGKDKNTSVINDLVKNLYKLSGEAGNPGYDEKLRIEIDTCLNKIPLWYPGPKKEQSGFKRSLVDRLTRRLKNLKGKNTSTNYSKRKPSRNAITEVHTSLTSCNQRSFSNQLTNDPRDVEVKICIIDWLRLIYSKTKNNNMLKSQIFLLADFVTLRINPLLNKKISTSNDDILFKTAILDIMNDLPIVIDCPINRDLHIQDLAKDLANKLLCIQEKYIKNSKSSTALCSKNCSIKCSCDCQRETVICNKIRKCLKDAKVDCNNMVIEEAGVILSNCYEITDPEGKRQARNKIMNLLITSTNLSKAQAWNLAKVLIKKVRKVFDEGEVCASSQTCSQLHNPFTTSVYTSIEEASPLTYLLTSTPKKKRVKKMIPKLNTQEIEYLENVANLIRTWMNTLPENFSAPDEQEFKETIINDLAGDIMDEAKLEQLAPDPKKDKREVRKYIVCRWIFKLGVFEFQEVDEKIEIFLNKLQEIPVPTMTQPQHGNRQVMENIKFYEGSKWAENFVPKGTDVLEDEISIWMHEQPSNIFTNSDKTIKQDKIHELAQVLANKLGKKSPQIEVSQDISKWLSQVVKPEKKREISELTENLKVRVIDLPQDVTLADIVENRSKIREEQKKTRLEIANSPKTFPNKSEGDESANQENTMAIFISKFIEHHYDIDDPMARRAYNRLLNSHLLSLNPTTREQVYDNFEKNEYDNRFPSRKVIKELEYIKDISDWLKNLPIEASYNSLGNRERIDFVNSLALSVREVEEDRENNPDAMDYDVYMGVLILEHLKLLPIPKEYHENTPFMINQLLNKIIAHRQAVSKAIKVNESINTTGVNPDNIGDFIEEFIRINGDDIAHDEVKMEAWAIRLIREINKIVPNTSRPSVLSKAHIYDKLLDVPVPSEETAKLFNLELDYVKEITSWMKNLPLLPMNDAEKDNATTNICNLAEKMVETNRKTLANPKDKEIHTDFKEYVAKWISKLPLDKKQEIVLPVIIQQLINRMEKLKPHDDLLKSKASETSASKSIKAKKSISSIFKLCKKNKELNSNNLTDAIEKWSHALPITSENDVATTNTKNDISRKLFQEVGQLNMNPTVNNDDILYKERLGDEIDTIFENTPQNNGFQNKKEKYKEDIINIIVDIKNEIKQKTAGDTYKLELEKTIGTSIPNPVPCYQIYDPGFEIYKGRLATAFILENFDHGADAVKTKYESLLKKEIDKYFDHARNRNAIPLSKDQLYNELYSALFKVPIPNEASVIDEVEKIKTRCEIDEWFEELPMREANSLNELLDWDKILATLATRIHEIEKSESKADNKIVKEIMKWLVKLPLQPGNENKLEDFATTLQKRLKSTADQRKCVLESLKTKSRKDKTKAKRKESTKKSKENSQIAGPSSCGKMWETLAHTQDMTNRRNTRKNPADEIYDIVHTWCNQLPINTKDEEHTQILKDDITTKMLIKISELNANPEIFNDDVMYDELLGEEFEGVLLTVPTTCNFSNSNAAKIHQLKASVISVKPHIVEERDNHKYKQDLINTVDKKLDRRQTSSLEKEAYLDAVIKKIVDNFVQYKYSNDDDEGKQGHKTNLQDNICKFSILNADSDTNVSRKDPKINTLMQANLLIFELAKILPKSHNILRDEVEEIRMKNEIDDFFNDIGVPTKDIAKVNYLKESLAKKLNNIEINGHSLENENKMKEEIMRCLKKLGKDKNPAVIDEFITKLKNNEKDRRMPQGMAKKSSEFIEQECNSSCLPRNQNLNGYRHPATLFTSNNMPANFAKRAACPSKKDRINAEAEYISHEGDEVIQLQEQERTFYEEESSSDDEDNEICLCKNNNGGFHKIMPYLMVPIPMRYFCEGRDVLNSIWCSMPLPLF